MIRKRVFFARIYINGRFSAFQADDMGSNPIVRILINYLGTGDITQLVECVLCKHKVISSNLIISIIKLLYYTDRWYSSVR